MMLPYELTPYLAQLGGYDRPTIHVAGSKGKGTTTLLVAELLRLKGHKVGRFLSPYVLEETECISINGENIPQSQMDEIRSTLSDKLSPFEQRTLIALKYFQDQHCDYVVLEVGWGGKDDATNVVESKIINIVTHLELEHTSTLGDELHLIAEKKMGIHRDGVPMITCQNQKELLEELAENMNVEMHYTDEFELGFHHPESVGHMMKVAEILNLEISEEELIQLEVLEHLGRFEEYELGPHKIIVDGAHTPHSVGYVISRVEEVLEEEEIPLIHWCIHFLKDKADELYDFFPVRQSTWIDIDDERAGLNPKNLPTCNAEEMIKAIQKLEEAQVFVFVGSFKLVADVKRALNSLGIH